MTQAQKTAKRVLDTVLQHVDESEPVPALVMRAVVRGQKVHGVTEGMQLRDFIQLCKGFTHAELKALRRGEDLVCQ